MGIGRFFKSLVDNEVMEEEIVETNVKTYFAAKKMLPNGTPLEWLTSTYLGRMRARRMTVREFDASEFCSQFDKLPEPQNARALGLSMLMQERRNIWSAYSKFSQELSRYMV